MTLESTPTRQAVNHGHISARIERLPRSRWQVQARIIVGAVTFFDGFEQLMLAYSLPLLVEKWSLSTMQTTWLITVGGLGMLVGALFGGFLADRIGRLKVVTGALVIFSVTSLGMAFTDSLEIFMLLRFIEGIGLGAAVPVGASYVNEIAKAKGRGKFVLLYETVFPVGLVISAITSSWIVPRFGYEVLFFIGFLPILLTPFVLRLPESPRWLASHGRLEDADASMRRIEEAVEKDTGKPLPPLDPTIVSEETNQRGSFWDLFSKKYLRRSLMLAGIWFCAYFVNYGIASWLPTIYSQNYNADVGTALRYSVATSVAGLVGCLIIAFIIDGLGRKICLSGAMLISSVLLFTLSGLGATSAIQVVIWTACTAVFIFAVNMALYVYTAELYPTKIRAMGSAWGGAWARIGIILGPIIVGQILATTGEIRTAFTLFGCVAFVGFLIVAVLGTETKEKTLEEINK